MRHVTKREFQDRVYAWAQVPTAERDRIPRIDRDSAGRPRLEYWARGKCYAQVVAVEGAFELYADRGGKTHPDQGKISFTEWLEPEQVYGDGKPHRMPIACRPPKLNR